MPLIRLTYASVARPGLDYEELTSLLRRAAVRNDELGITGILCFSGNAFLQSLEGRRSDVNRLFLRIAQDTRHTNVELLSCTEIDARDFSDWSMKLVSWEGKLTAQRRALLLRHARTAALEPWTMTASQAHGFLRALAELERQQSAA
ncbi:MAG: BLUF domain-containing protein [Gemmatimonadota bacterium]